MLVLSMPGYKILVVVLSSSSPPTHIVLSMCACVKGFFHRFFHNEPLTASAVTRLRPCAPGIRFPAAPVLAGLFAVTFFYDRIAVLLIFFYYF